VFSTDLNRTPTVELDPSEADRWKFIRQPFTTASLVIDDSTMSFKPTQAGKSVHVFSYRPVPTDVATGDGSSEAYAVRVVETIPVASVIDDYSSLRNGTNQMADFVSDPDLALSISSGNHVADWSDQTVEFWAQFDASSFVLDTDRELFRQSASAVDRIVIGMRSAGDQANPSGLFLKLNQGGQELQVEVDSVILDGRWHHWAFGVSNDTVRVFLDGLLVKERLIPFSVSSGAWTEAGIGSDGADDPVPPCFLDNLRIWGSALDGEEIRVAMSGYDASGITESLEVELLFDTAVLEQGSHFHAENGGVVDGVTAFVGSDGHIDASYHGAAEVATRLETLRDLAGFGSGYVLNRVSNYNEAIYQRGEANGRWGGLYPVNWSGLYQTNFFNALEVAYFANPFFTMPSDLEGTHPNVSWPYTALRYDDVAFPAEGEHGDKRVYVSSRLGTEGVDSNGIDQPVFDPNFYGELTIYNQADPSAAGYNPNEEHALIASSIKDQLTGNNAFNLGQNAAFALQNSINIIDESDAARYTSEPWVLVQYRDLVADELKMAAYKVEETRAGSALFPALDPTTHEVLDSLGQAVPQPSDPTYDFDYPSFAGDILIPPYPLNLVIGAVILEEHSGGNLLNDAGIAQRAIWNDINGNTWVVSGNGNFFGSSSGTHDGMVA